MSDSLSGHHAVINKIFWPRLEQRKSEVEVTIGGRSGGGAVGWVGGDLSVLGQSWRCTELPASRGGSGGGSYSSTHRAMSRESDPQAPTRSGIRWPAGGASNARLNLSLSSAGKNLSLQFPLLLLLLLAPQPPVLFADTAGPSPGRWPPGRPRRSEVLRRGPAPSPPSPLQRAPLPLSARCAEERGVAFLGLGLPGQLQGCGGGSGLPGVSHAGD